MKLRLRILAFICGVAPVWVLFFTSVEQSDITISAKLFAIAFIWMVMAIVGFLVLYPDALKDSEEKKSIEQKQN